MSSLLGCAALAAAASGASPRLLVPDDYYSIQTPSDLQMSPDGQWIAYILTSNDRDADEARSAVWMVGWDGAQQVPLTHPAKGIRSPRWSPDGRRLAYISHAKDPDTDRIMILDRRGGEAQPLVGITGEIDTFAWSPDGMRMVLAMDGGGDHGAGAPPAGGALKSPKPIVINALHFKQDEDGYLGVGHEHHLFLLDIESKKLEPLTGEAGFNEHLPVWSPDGGRIAFSRTRELGPDSDGREDIDVMESRVGATVRTVVRPYAPNRQSLAWLADGAGIVFVQGVEPKYNQYIQDQLALVPLPRGAPRPMATALDRAIKSYALSVDSRSITAIVEDDGSAYPAQIDLATGKVTRRVEGQFVASALSEAGGHAALISSTDVSAPEVYALEASALRKLTSHNDALFDGLRLGEVHDVRFPGKDGADIHGMLVLPPAYVLGRRYPTILWIHGGPNGQDAHALTLKSDQFLRQLLAAQGFVVLGVNYRGSSGRGNTFAQSIVADWGHREVQDVLDGVDHLIARGIADPARLAIGGWSYGAILTNYTIAGDHRFKAAFSGAGSADMSGMYGSDEYILQYSNELGAPWRNTALWLKLSYPFLHADKIRTPTLFMGGDKDFDVPLAGGEQMYQALRTLGVPTQLVVYPGESHVFSRPSYLKDRAERMVTWFNRFLAPKQ